MGWRNIYISSPVKLNLVQNQLRITKEGEELDVPLEDIAVIVVECLQTFFTGQLISEFAQRGIAFLICDRTHLPCGELLSYHQHSRMSKSFLLQINASEPFRKNCWRLIVRRKILNQARCLDLLWLQEGDTLRRLAATVKSGDPENRESQAAQIYFSQILPNSTRRIPSPVNDALNYGYSIFRGAVARALAAHGFLPALGIHHRNELNHFNLADDFIETLRPLVDLWVSTNVGPGKSFVPAHRQSLVSLLTSNLLINGEHQTVLRCTEIMIAAFLKACKEKNPSLLELPELLPFSEHAYE